MKISQRTQHGYPLTSFISVLAGVILTSSLLAGTIPVAAQASQDNWSLPINLSQSGAATEPQIVVDSNGRFHALWQDEFSGFVYSTGDGTEWSEPVALEFPFGENQPLLVADKIGYIHAFWIDEEDETSFLRYSQIISGGFSNFDSWTGNQTISDSAVAFDVAIAPGGDMHLAYLRNTEGAEQQAGIYYTRLSSGSSLWSLSTALEVSPYFRSLTAEDSNVKVSATETPNGEQVYVAWDNRPRGRIFLAKSSDGGETWGAGQEMPGPEEGTVALGPANITVHAQEDNLLIMWQTGQTERGCNQFSKWSFDGGVTWQPSQQMYLDLGLCPSEIQFLDSGNGLILVLIEEQINLQAWNGSEWSAPQLQEALSGFIDPDTQRQVSLSCHQAVLFGAEDMYMIGCGSGPADDIWLMQRSLLDLENWFAGEPVWSPPATITSTPSEIINPTLIVDGEERVHAFWSQQNNPIAGTPGIFIFHSFYSRLEGGQWSIPEPILSSPEGKAIQTAATVDGQGRIMVVWSGGKTGEIYFSHANPATASTPSAWSEPVQLPASFPGARSPDIAVDADGNIYVVYTISLNEGRGVYLTSSSDNGTNWRQPLQIFDAITAHWPMVDSPRLAITSRNHLHLLWTRNSLPPDAFPEALFYSQSQDGGVTWTPSQPVVEKPALWSELIGVGENTVNRIWQEQGSAGTTIWHEVSRDDGLTWERTAPVSIFGEIIKSPSVSADRAARLHLMQIVTRGLSSYALQHWVFDGERWDADQSLEMNLPGVSEISSPVAYVSPNGALNVLFSSVSGDEASASLQNNLLVTSRTLEVPEATPSATQIPVTTPAPTAKVQPTPNLGLTPVPVVIPTEITPTPTVILNNQGGGSLFRGTILGPLIGGILVVVVISGFFFLRGFLRR